MSISSNQRDESTKEFFFQLSNQILLHLWLCWNIRWTHEVFQGIRRWHVIKLVTLIHGHSYLIVLEIVVGYWKLRSFRETQVSLRVTRETRCHVSIAKLLIQNLMSHVAELFRRPGTMLEIFYFSGDNQFFQKVPRIKFLYGRGRELLHLLAGETISAKLSIGEALGQGVCIGALGQGVCIAGKSFCDTTLFKTLEMNYQKITNCFLREEPN